MENRAYKCDICTDIQPANTMCLRIDTEEPIKTYLICSDCALKLLGSLIHACEDNMLAQIIEITATQVKRERIENAPGQPPEAS